jgi:hypothetical protein
MSPLVGMPFLLAVVAVVLLSGYWLNGFDLADTLAERLALAAVAGLATLLLVAVAVNFFLPLSGAGMGACLLPAAGTGLWPRTRRSLLADGRALLRSRSGLMVILLTAAFLTWLLRMFLWDPQALFFDGTTNHDSYIWITSGEFLQHHTYMEAPAISAAQPWMNMAEDNIGWHPRRGQLATETLLALFSSLAGTTPLKTCLYFSGALFLPWIAATYLVVITFFRTRISRGALAAIVLLQPIFVFFHANSNLPNLLGAILGATVVIATEQALRAGTRRSCLGWSTLLVLGFHGLIAGYPEMTPFIVLPCALLWLRPWAARHWETVRSRGLWVAAAFITGSVINPAITVRAWYGFRYSFGTARADAIFANLLQPLNAAEHLPGLATLSVPAALGLGHVKGTLLTVVILASAGVAWWRARDRWGAVFTLAGSGTLLLYTLFTGFNYGLQKSVQFGAVFIVAILTAPLLDTQLDGWRKGGWRRLAAGIGLATVVGFFAYATAMNFRESKAWSRQKMISRDWFDLRQLSATSLHDQPVLVESASFRMPFFHSMWASYFLSSSRSYFARRGDEGGGYLRLGVLHDSDIPGGSPAAFLVGRRWAESFDANSPRLLAGREYVLLREANRVTDLQGVYPLNGYPDHAATRFAIEITPHAHSRLRLTLIPATKEAWPAATWRVVNRTESGETTVRELHGAPPWQIEVALTPHVRQTVECQLLTPAASTDILPFAISQLLVESIP